MQDKLGLHCQRALDYGLSRVSKLTFKIRLNQGGSRALRQRDERCQLTALGRHKR